MREIRPRLRWAITIVYLVTLPFLRDVWEFLNTRSSTLADLFPLAMGVLLIVALAVYLVRIKRERRPRVYAALCGVILLYLYSFFTLSMPIERVHLAQYGLLSVLVYWSMARGGEGIALCAWAAIVTIEFGLADECIQGLLRARIYDFNDLILNAKAALLGQLLMAFVIRPWEGSSHPRPGRVRAVGRGPVACAVLACAILASLTALNISIIEQGTPTIRDDVHAGHGALAYRDGFRRFGRRTVIVNAVIIAMLLLALVAPRWYLGPAAGEIRTVIIAGLCSPLILLAGKLCGMRFR